MNTRIICFVCAATLALCFIPTITTEAQLFEPSVEYEVGVGPRSVAIGDLDGDGYPDLAAANEWSDDVSVLLGNGDGTFQAAVDYGAGEEPCSVAIGDLDGDSNPDLAVANRDSDDVSVLLGNGDGTFHVAVNYGVGTSPYSVAIGDLDGDSNPDLAVANSGSDNVSVLLGYGDGTFQTAVNYGVGNRPRSVAIGDLDGDGNPDLAVANYWHSKVSVLLGNGDGTFHVAVNYGVGTSPYSVAIGDLDGDSNPDLAVANYSSDNVSVLLGNGDGTFQAAVDYGAGNKPTSVAIVDLDGDSQPDLVTANYYSDTGAVSVLLGNGDGTFQLAGNYWIGGRPQSVAIGDLDGDTYPDLATANNYSHNASVLINTTGTVSAEIICTPSSGTLPLNVQFNIAITNVYTGFDRRVFGHIDVLAAGGKYIPNWKSGTVTLGPGGSITPSFHQMLPGSFITFIGTNNFKLFAVDITPSPYNQPPYPASGDTDTATCTVVGIAP